MSIMGTKDPCKLCYGIGKFLLKMITCSSGGTGNCRRAFQGYVLLTEMAS